MGPQLCLGKHGLGRSIIVDQVGLVETSNVLVRGSLDGSIRDGGIIRKRRVHVYRRRVGPAAKQMMSAAAIVVAKIVAYLGQAADARLDHVAAAAQGREEGRVLESVAATGCHAGLGVYRVVDLGVGPEVRVCIVGGGWGPRLGPPLEGHIRIVAADIVNLIRHGAGAGVIHITDTAQHSLGVDEVREEKGQGEQGHPGG